MAEAEDTGSSRYGEIKELRRNVTRAVTNYGQGWHCFVIDGARWKRNRPPDFRVSNPIPNIPLSESLEAKANRSIDLKEFVPVAKIDPVYFESVYSTGAVCNAVTG